MQDESTINRINPRAEKPLIGVPLGKFRITIRSANQAFHTELEGELYDATTRFVNPWLVSKFKRAVCNEINLIHPIEDQTPIYEEQSNPSWSLQTTALAPIQGLEKMPTEELVKAFRSFPLGKVCRVLILDEDFSSYKHIILQFGNLNPLTDYATIPESLKRSIARGQKVTFSTYGEGFSFPTRRLLPDDLGKGFIHWFIPDDHIKGSILDLSMLQGAEALCGIVVWIRQTLKIDEYKKVKDEQIKAGDDARKEMADEVQAKSTENDLSNLALSRLQRHGQKDNLPIKRGDLYDFLMYSLPTMIFALMGWSFGNALGVFGGMLIGLLVGGFLANRRR